MNEIKSDIGTKIGVVLDWVLILPIAILIFIAIILKLLIILIFIREKFQKTIYKYLSAKAFADAIFLSIVSITLLRNYSLLSGSFESFSKRAVQLFVNYYMVCVSNLLSFLISAKIAFDRLIFVCRGSSEQAKHKFYLILFIFMIISLLPFLPHIFLMKIKQSNALNETLNATFEVENEIYVIDIANIAPNSVYLINIFVSTQYLPHLVCAVILIVCNIGLLIKMKKEFQHYKQRLLIIGRFRENSTTNNIELINGASSSENRRFSIFDNTKKPIEWKITWIVVGVSFTTLLFQISMTCCRYVFYIYDQSTLEFKITQLVLYTMAFFCHFFNFIIFYKLDKTFRSQVIGLKSVLFIKKIVCKNCASKAKDDEFNSVNIENN